MLRADIYSGDGNPTGNTLGTTLAMAMVRDLFVGKKHKVGSRLSLWVQTSRP
jgi:hypothetical protein